MNQMEMNSSGSNSVWDSFPGWYRENVYQNQLSSQDRSVNNRALKELARGEERMNREILEMDQHYDQHVMPLLSSEDNTNSQ
jgi:hypothetical protein